MLFFLLTITVLFLLSFFIFLVMVSPGKLKPLTDQNGKMVEGSICEKTFVKIGGVKQGMFIRGKDLHNPVLLFVTGGPSFSEYFLVEKYLMGIENYFTVCYWEERGGGISYTPQVTMKSMTLEQLASDAIDVTNYLRDRFGKEKIYIMAHSGGTAFAIQAIASHPELFFSYVGISQITWQAKSEELAYKYMFEKFSNDDNLKMIAQFNKYPVVENDSFLLPFFNSVLRDKAMHELGIGTMRHMKSIINGVFYPVWTCRAYTLREKFNIWYSKFSFINNCGLREQILYADIPAKVPKLDIPAYFFSGKYDLTVNHDLSKEYLKNLESPLKGFYTFKNSAHSPIFEEPQRCLEILIKDVLRNKTDLADH